MLIDEKEITIQQREIVKIWEDESKFNACYENYCDNLTGLMTKKRTNATEWEQIYLNPCYEHVCDNTSGGIIEKRTNATEWENRTNACYIYECKNDTGGIAQKRTNATEWEEMYLNSCYEYVCDNTSGGVIGKRTNATEWENRTNACYVYECKNDTGGIIKNECSKHEKICIYDTCIKKSILIEQKGWEIKIEFNNPSEKLITPEDILDEVRKKSEINIYDITVMINYEEGGSKCREILIYAENKKDADTLYDIMKNKYSQSKITVTNLNQPSDQPSQIPLGKADTIYCDVLQPFLIIIMMIYQILFTNNQ